MMRKPRETVDTICCELTDFDQQLGILHRTKLGSLIVGDSYVAWSVCGALEPGFIPIAYTSFLEPIIFGRIPFST